MLDQRLLCLLKTPSFPASPLNDGALGRIEVLVARDTTDLCGFRGSRLSLFPFKSHTRGHRLSSFARSSPSLVPHPPNARLGSLVDYPDGRWRNPRKGGSPA